MSEGTNHEGIEGQCAISAAVVCAGAKLCGVLAKPVWAQVRAALVQDSDNPALSPYRASIDMTPCCLFDGRLLTTVPAGKRLIIEHISCQSSGEGGQMIAGVLERAVRNGTRIL